VAIVPVPAADVPVSATVVAKKIDWWKNKCKKTIEHENRDFNCGIGRIKQLDVNAGQRQWDMEKK
jgi:hypothetical protein